MGEKGTHPLPHRSFWFVAPLRIPYEHTVRYPRYLMSDRGTARYFDGHIEERQRFADGMKEAVVTNGAAIFLIQGTPGSGKTALPAEYLRIAYTNHVTYGLRICCSDHRARA